MYGPRLRGNLRRVKCTHILIKRLLAFDKCIHVCKPNLFRDTEPRAVCQSIPTPHTNVLIRSAWSRTSYKWKRSVLRIMPLTSLDSL